MSLPKISLAGAVVIVSSLLHTCCINGASVRQHKMRDDEPESRLKTPYFVPNSDMVKALEYIENLRQQTNDEEPIPDYDDMEKFRSLLRLAPVQNMAGPEQSAAPDVREAWQDDKSQWVKILLRALQRAEKESKPSLSGTRFSFNNRQYAEEDSPADEIGDYGDNPLPERNKPLKKYQLLFEDEDSRENPYKRTNEIVEEQYTPQSLATLESVFEELGKLSAPSNQKRQSLDEDQRFYRDNDDDIYRVNNLAYEDVAGGEDWTPVEEKVETETEEVKDSREEFDRGSDEAGDSLKRSSQPKYAEKEDPDDFNKLVDRYLLKFLEKSERNEKRDNSERPQEEQNNEKRTVGPSGSLEVDPQAIYQLIEISRRLQIPPEDLIEMLKSGEVKKQDKILEAEVEPEVPEDLDRIEDKLSQISPYNKERVPAKKPFNRRLPEMLPNDIPDDLNTEDVLKILGLEAKGNPNPKYILKQIQSKHGHSRLSAPSARRGDYVLSEPSGLPGDYDKTKMDYDEATDDDELATYLAARLLSKYPKMLNKIDLKRTPQLSSKEDQVAYGTYEQAMKDYFDHISSDKTSPTKRLSEDGEQGNASKSQRLDEDMLLKMLGYLNQETRENEDRDIYGKKLNGM
nr:PREDICTED: secretogranin-2 [Lepisosteus oculatus]